MLSSIEQYFQAPYRPISDDGRFIAFSTNATNLDPDDQNSVDDVYLHDVDSGETTWVNR
jgi:hypothetical protein